MKYLRNFNESISHDEIHSICQKYLITNYTINANGSSNVEGNVHLSGKKLTEIPLRFGTVTGYFACDHNLLTSLQGSPKWVGTDFYCDYNQLTSLQGGPEYVGEAFYCNHNKLTNLEGAPRTIHSFYCRLNPIHKWWDKINNMDKLEAFIDLGIDTNNPDWINQEKIDYIK